MSIARSGVRTCTAPSLDDFMSIKLVGNINVALVFGLSQFVTTFMIARLYATHAQKSLDPLAEELERAYRKAVK